MPAEALLNTKELEAIRHIRNALHRTGQAPSIRQLQALLGYRSPRSAADVLKRLAEKEIVSRRPDGRLQLLRDPDEDRQHAQTIDVPLVGSVACGAPLIADENIEAMVPVSLRLARPPHRYFLLRANGDSMNATGINDGDLVLVRQQTDADNGDRVVALIDNAATIKEFQKSSEALVLTPRSTNPEHSPIVLTDDFQVQGLVIATIPRTEAVVD